MFRRSVTAAALLAALTTPLLAQGRPDARTMTCDQVQRLISENGGIVLTTGRFTYDRYVAGQPWCDTPYVPMSVSIATADTNFCPVFNCQPPPDDHDLWRRL